MLYDDTFLTRRPSGGLTAMQSSLGLMPIFEDQGKNLCAAGASHKNRRRLLKQRGLEAMTLPGTGSFLKPDIVKVTTGVT
jgi:hypothetical protein